MSSSTRLALGDALDLIIDHRGRTPKKLGGDFLAQGVQVVSAKNVYGGRLHADENTRFVSEEMATRWMPRAVASGDVLLTSEAPLGQVAYIDRDAGFCLGQRLFALRAKPGVLNGRFLFYLLQSPRSQRLLAARASGTTAQGIRQSELRLVEFEFPPLPLQEAVAETLGALDDKIDSNRRLAGLLEETAATLFRGRFIEFAGVTDLVDSELGPIPRGWRVCRLGDVVTVLRRGIGPKYVDAGGVCVLNQKCVRDFRIVSGPSRRHDAQKKRIEGREIAPGDTLINSTGVGTLGRLAQVRYLSEPTIVDSHVTVVRADEDVIRSDYLAMALFAAQPTIEALGEGSTGQTELSRARLGELAIVVPPLVAQDEYLQVAQPLRLRSDGAERESTVLAEIRDTLLPKLVSGEIRVREAEEIVDAA